MMLDRLERARAQCIASYICYEKENAKTKKGNYEERGDKIFQDYRKCCKEFADRICAAKAQYQKLNNNKRNLLVDEFTKSLDGVIEDIELLSCEMGIQIGFKLALDLGLQGYNEEREIDSYE